MSQDRICALWPQSKKMTDWRTELKTALSGQNHDTINQPMDQTAQALFPTVIPTSQINQIDWGAEHDPLALQFLPSVEENHVSPNALADPVGDTEAGKQHGIIHKYKGRVLLIASGSCAVNCRYCFRRHFDYQAQYAPRNQWRQAIQYISKDPSIHEVILSGGDPLTLGTERLQSLTDQLQTLPHISTLRIHSRIPTVLPERIDQPFLNWLKALPLDKVLVLHCNHPKEFNQAATEAITRLRQSNVTLLNQSVLLKGVNDDADTLASLSHVLFKQGVLPYYLHQFDRVQNAMHFEVPLEQAQKIHQQLQQMLPGYLVPKLALEEAGESSKTWVNG